MRLSSKSTEKNDMALSHYMAYVAPIIILAFLFGAAGILQGIYAKYFGVALTTIAAVLLISRLFDAVIDPIIGYWSDHHYAKTGTRKPFVVVGGVLFIVSSYFLYVPVDINALNAETSVSTAYFLSWFLLFYLAWTLLEIPHLAWGGDLATSAKAKNKLFSFRGSATWVGVLFFFLVPLLPFFPSNEFTPQTLRWAAIGAGLMMLPALYYCVKVIPDGTTPNTIKADRQSLWALRYEIMANTPFLIFISAFCLQGLAAGMWGTLIFIVADVFLNLGHHFALVTVAAVSSGIASVSFWYWLANRSGKKLAWGVGALCYACGIGITGFLTPEQTGVLGLTTVLLLVYTGFTPIISLSPSLLTDIIDYGRWKFGTDYSATYFALYTLVMKTAVAIGGSIGLGIAGGFGFEPFSAEHTSEAVFGLRLAVSWLPATVMVLAVGILALVPLTTRRSHIIRCRLERRCQPVPYNPCSMERI